MPNTMQVDKSAELLVDPVSCTRYVAVSSACQCL